MSTVSCGAHIGSFSHSVVVLFLDKHVRLGAVLLSGTV